MSTLTTMSPIQHRNKKKIYSVENLNRFVECDASLLTPALRAARTRSLTRGTGFYGYLPVMFPLHYRAFRNIHDSELSEGHNVSHDFDMSSKGLINFILAAGPVPSNLQNPILARINASEGFITGNLKWVNEKIFRPVSARRALEFANLRYSYQ